MVFFNVEKILQITQEEYCGMSLVTLIYRCTNPGFGGGGGGHKENKLI